MPSFNPADAIRAALPPDVGTAADTLVVQLAEIVADRLAHDHPDRGEDLYCLNLLSYAGERLGPVLRRLADVETRLARVAALLTGCPPPDMAGGYDSCAHGGWPCDLTRAAWLAAGVDPVAELAAHATRWRTQLAGQDPS